MSEEGIQRYKNFVEKVKNIKEHNADTTKSWKLALNHFSDLTKEEFREKIFNERYGEVE